MADTVEKLPWNMTVEERIESSKQMKDLGNNFFSQGIIKKAKESYTNGLKRIIPAYEISKEQQLEVDSLKLAFYLNIAACQMKMEQFQYVVKNCSKALSIDSNNTKALYRRSVALTELNEFERAQDDVKSGLLVENDNKALKRQLARIEKKWIVQKKKYQGMMKNCFNNVNCDGNIRNSCSN